MQSSGDTLRVGDHCPTTGQGVQAADPGADLKVPVGQGEHGLSAGPKKPGAHKVQLLMEELPAGAERVGGQGVQVLEKKTFSPVVVEKKPGPHRGMHVELELAPVVLLEDNTKVLNVVESAIDWPQDSTQVSVGT